MSTQTNMTQTPEALRQQAFDALYRGDVETAQATFVVEGALVVPAAVLRWTQCRLAELRELRKEVYELKREKSRLEHEVRELEETLNPPEEPENICPSCGTSL